MIGNAAFWQWAKAIHNSPPASSIVPTRRRSGPEDGSNTSLPPELMVILLSGGGLTSNSSPVEMVTLAPLLICNGNGSGEDNDRTRLGVKLRVPAVSMYLDAVLTLIMTVKAKNHSIIASRSNSWQQQICWFVYKIIISVLSWVVPNERDSTFVSF